MSDQGDLLEKALRTFLLDDAAIAAVVGDRVHVLKGVQSQRGAKIVFQIVSSTEDYHYKGSSDLLQDRVQIAAWATTRGAAGALAGLVRKRLNGARGWWPYGTDSPRAQLNVQGIFIVHRREGEDTGAQLFHVSRDYMIHYKERFHA